MYANLDKQPTSPMKNVARSITTIRCVCPSPCHTTVAIAADIEAVTWIVCCARMCKCVFILCAYCSGPDPFLLLLIKFTGSEACSIFNQKTERRMDAKSNIHERQRLPPHPYVRTYTESVYIAYQMVSHYTRTRTQCLHRVYMCARTYIICNFLKTKLILYLLYEIYIFGGIFQLSGYFPIRSSSCLPISASHSLQVCTHNFRLQWHNEYRRYVPYV